MEPVHVAKDLTQADAEAARGAVKGAAQAVRVSAPVGTVCAHHVDIQRHMPRVAHVAKLPALPVGRR